MSNEHGSLKGIRREARRRRHHKHRNNGSYPHMEKLGPSYESVDYLAARLRIDHWDLILAGDGAGSDWSRPCGWAGAVIDHKSRRRAWLHGAMNMGSIGMAELMPYVQALLWHSATHGKALRRFVSPRPIMTHIISDNKGLVDQGNRLVTNDKTAAEIKMNYPLWKTLLDFGRDGYHFTFHRVDRLEIALNLLADTQADKSKKAIADATLPDINELLHQCNGDSGAQMQPVGAP